MATPRRPIDATTIAKRTGRLETRATRHESHAHPRPRAVTPASVELIHMTGGLDDTNPDSTSTMDVTTLHTVGTLFSDPVANVLTLPADGMYRHTVWARFQDVSDEAFAGTRRKAGVASSDYGSQFTDQIPPVASTTHYTGFTVVRHEVEVEGAERVCMTDHDCYVTDLDLIVAWTVEYLGEES